MAYPFLAIERKWQDYWDMHQTFLTRFTPGKPKAYILDMYPYPSRWPDCMSAIPEGYTATDICLPLQEDEGLQCAPSDRMGRFRIASGTVCDADEYSPRITTADNIATFRRQIKMLGLSYDWSREVDTTDPGILQMDTVDLLKMYGSWVRPGKCGARGLSGT